jgi:hypothetical protein
VQTALLICGLLYNRSSTGKGTEDEEQNSALYDQLEQRVRDLRTVWRNIIIFGGTLTLFLVGAQTAKAHDGADGQC